MPTRYLRLIVYAVAVTLAVLNFSIFWGYGSGYWFQNPSPPQNYQTLGDKLQKLGGKRVVLVGTGLEYKVPAKELELWLESFQREYTGRQEYRFNSKNVKKYLENLARKINRPPADARLVISEGRAAEFSPHQNGFHLDVFKSSANLMVSLAHDDAASKSVVDLTVKETEPTVTLAKINDLGINVLLGRGESDFSGSPKARTHNIHIGSKIFNGIILKPGEIFSFNNLLGPVDASIGYLPELVIKEGKLTPEYGGGICQVSTTLFRAAIVAGLPVTERRPHSLPVRYYNPQGFDATVYPGSADLKFRNDTSTHILIQTKIVGTKIDFEIYGTADGRHVVLDGPRQYDIQPNGAMKAVLKRIVTYTDGTEKKDEFRSSYKSPSLFPTVRNPLE